MGNPSLTLTSEDATNFTIVADQNSRISAVETSITSLDARLDSAESTINILQSNVSSLGSRLDSAETDIDSLETITSTHTSQIVSLDTRLDIAESDITTLDGSLNSAIGDITSIDGRVTVVEGRPGIEALSTASAINTALAANSTVIVKDVSVLDSQEDQEITIPAGKTLILDNVSNLAWEIIWSGNAKLIIRNCKLKSTKTNLNDILGLDSSSYDYTLTVNAEDNYDSSGLLLDEYKADIVGGLHN